VRLPGLLDFPSPRLRRLVRLRLERHLSRLASLPCLLDFLGPQLRGLAGPGLLCLHLEEGWGLARSAGPGLLCLLPRTRESLPSCLLGLLRHLCCPALLLEERRGLARSAGPGLLRLLPRTRESLPSCLLGLLRHLCCPALLLEESRGLARSAGPGLLCLLPRTRESLPSCLLGLLCHLCFPALRLDEGWGLARSTRLLRLLQQSRRLVGALRFGLHELGKCGIHLALKDLAIGLVELAVEILQLFLVRSFVASCLGFGLLLHKCSCLR